MATTITLGNTAPVDSTRDKNGNLRRESRPDLGNQFTTVSLPDDPPAKPSDVLKIIRDLWPWHSDADGPEWVESDDEALAGLVAAEFTDGGHKCRVGRPRGWKEG